MILWVRRRTLNRLALAAFQEGHRDAAFRRNEGMRLDGGRRPSRREIEDIAYAAGYRHGALHPHDWMEELPLSVWVRVLAQAMRP